MEDKTIKGTTYSEENQIEERMEWIKKWLNVLKKDHAKLNDYRDRWTDFDVAVICWFLAHNPDELEFWKETELWKINSKMDKVEDKRTQHSLGES